MARDFCMDFQRPVTRPVKWKRTVWKLKSLKRCCKDKPLMWPCCVDRLTSLPDDLLGRILSLLPTKDVTALRILSKTMYTRALACLSSLDLDDSVLCNCGNHPLLFKLFVDDVLDTFSRSRQPLTRYRLRVGGDRNNNLRKLGLREHCDSHKQLARLNAWISYPLSYPGLKELDLGFHVIEPSRFQLPPGLFACKSLEVLKLDSNLVLDAPEIPVISLPNMKLLHLHSLTITEDDFITRLLSGCPSLEDLAIVYCSWKQSDRLVISSHSLRRLELVRPCGGGTNGDLVLIDTPNLHYFTYAGDLASRCSIRKMNAFVRANASLDSKCVDIPLQIPLSLIRTLSNVQHLSLLKHCMKILLQLTDQLPVFHNLKTLEMGPIIHSARWDKLLLEILTCSPCLETLFFPQGMFICSRPGEETGLKAADLEDQNLRTTEATPGCFEANFKRIIIKEFAGSEREVNIIKFLLRKASVLEEFIIECLPRKLQGPIKCTMLSDLPRASISCSIGCTRTLTKVYPKT